MDIDIDIANWILDFFLRQPIEDSTLNSLLHVLPLLHDNPTIQKLLLMRKLENDVSRREVSETTLNILEQLEELEFQRSHESVSDAMKHAYCALAVECSLKLMKAEDNDDKDGSRSFIFLKMAKKLWRNRIGRMEIALEHGGLGSEALWAWKAAIEAAVWDDNACNILLKKFEGVQAEEAVRVYLTEERMKMGPSFLESAAEAVGGLQTIVGTNGVDGVTGIVQSSDYVPCPSSMELNSSARLNELDKSIDGSQEDIACRAVPQLSSPKRINTSPSQVSEVNNLKQRRKGRRWSLLEEDTLRVGVEKYGIGNWKVIKTVYQDIFEGRTEVNLKDKWRNLKRY